MKRVLIANRGEIAVRVARTVQQMGMQAVAVFAEADREALHPEVCDRAFVIPHYLDQDALLNLAVDGPPVPEKK